jgi:hypothetical protein
VIAGIVAAEYRAGADVPEYAAKAEFVERFTRFIDWPAAASPPAQEPFVLCQLGDSPLGAQLDSIAKLRSFKGHRAVFRRPSSLDQIDGCHVLVIAANERARLPQVLARTRTRPILTIGDGEGLAERGVLISFYMEPPLVRFEVNASAAKASGLQFSAQLMRLGRIVASAP